MTIEDTAPLDEIYTAAADLIEEKGWTRGTYYRNGRYCLVGAIQHVIHVEPRTWGPEWVTRQHPIRYFRNFLTETEDHYIANIYEWNDTQPSRRPIITALRECAQRYRRNHRE